MKADMQKIRADPRPRGGKRVGSAVWFDVELSLPMGLKVDEAPNGAAIGVTEVIEGGGAAAHNNSNMFEVNTLRRQNFVQQGDRILSIDGKPCNDKETLVELITEAQERGHAKVKFARERKGFVTVKFLDTNRTLTVGPKTFVRIAAEAAGVTTSCSERGCDGSCWHVNDMTGEIYPLCSDLVVGEIPSLTKFASDAMFQGFWDEDKAEEDRTFENTEALVLRKCPELYEKAVREWSKERA